ncbi:cryptochrome/photolyase family protein [Salinarimonas ramus]|uniref:(6-4) photolyase n=1 Tax=Salinarimonas ramus TaxID=690164 RepID=A0A917V4S7_9HYPH|nr:cryptochrome/photolyase family protein [Salinarimonas ramus]GGK36682.1 (6-4) photolyase [Salinarimonas ramus]
MGTLRLLLGDQLTRAISSLSDLDAETDVVLMVEVAEEATYVRHHKQKIAFLFSAMRHFAQALRVEGITVDYVRLDDPENAGSFGAELARAVERHHPERVVVTEPGEWRVLEMMRDWREELGLPVEIREDNRFLATKAEFGAWAGEKKHLRMEYFYREMRRKTGFLMEGREPVGGQWNFDAQNRKALPKTITVPPRRRFEPDAITREVLDLVARRFGNHFGDLEPFGWGVTRAQALEALRFFVEEALPTFGDYQDAMKTGEPFLFHAVLSPYLNAGLLTAEEVCVAAEREWREGRAPLNAVEGFIRQIIGWREYVRGLYWLKMPAYADTNALEATRPLPDFYWTGETEMNCLAQCVGDTRRHAYAHHIQRLMVLGNFALLAGLRPAEVEEWYLVVYADAYEWVELPNVHGMILYADGGVLASKPYAASGAYIDRMSDYCAACTYSPKVKEGERACPFNYLYWNFLIENEARLVGNPRIAMPYRTLAKMSDDRKAAIREDADRFLGSLTSSYGT